MKKIMFNNNYGLTDSVLRKTKTHTRSICNLTLHNSNPKRIFYQDGLWKFELRGHLYNLPKESQPKYQIGEVVAIAQAYNDFITDDYNRALFPDGAGWTNKMFVKADLMPHQIRITDIRVERLQDISNKDCIKEGVEKVLECDNMYRIPILNKSGKTTYLLGISPREVYATLIDKIYGKGTWKNNPYVFVYEFELVK